MTTVINNPGNGESSGAGALVGAVALIVLVVLFFVYALPAIRNSRQAPAANTAELNVKIPTGGGAQTSGQ